MKYKRENFCSVLILVLIFSSAIPLYAESSTQKILIKVEGLYCPFCAYGLEKQLKKLKGFKKVEVNLKHGTAELFVQPGVTVTDAAIQKAVEDAGFDFATIDRMRNEDRQ